MPTYRIDRSYDWNYEHGPSFEGPYPRVPRTPEKEFLGFPVRSRLGISAGLLLNSRWIRVYARLGYDILTYKTVRSRHRKCYPLPNWVYLDRHTPLEPRETGESLVRRRGRPGRHVTSSVSFGMPSKDPAIWSRDVGRARKALRPGQVLVVSVVASPEPGQKATAMAREFGHLTRLAREAGAHIVEANLSCPNVCTAEGSVYLDAALSRSVAREMRRNAGSTPLLLKAGHFPDTRRLAAFLRRVDGLADGVVLVNGVSRRILNRDGTPAFGHGREIAGVLGHGIHRACLDNVRQAVEIVRRQGLALRIAAVGGVLSGEDARRYFEAGACAVLMGGAPMFDPHLAVRFKKTHPEW